MAAERLQRLALTWLDVTTQHEQLHHTCLGFCGLVGKALDSGSGDWDSSPSKQVHFFLLISRIVFIRSDVQD
jgi:hypothetical protein